MMKRMIAALVLLCLMLNTAMADTTVYTSDGEDQSVVDLGGSGTLMITDALIRKTGGSASSADAASFRGVNAAVRVYDQASLTLCNAVIEATAPMPPAFSPMMAGA